MLNLCLLLAMIVGHTTLWVAYVNRTHALPLHGRTLHRLRRLHDAFLPLGPVLIVVCYGLTGPRLLLGGSWFDMQLWPAVLAGICFVGFFGQCVATLRFQLSRPPREQRTLASRVVDIAAIIGERPIAAGRYERLARIPFNQQFEVEFNEKELTLPSLPTAWDGLSILHLSDWHFQGTVDRRFFETVTEELLQKPVDLICFTGDLIDDMQWLDWLPTTLGRLSAPHGCYYILGNHDWDHDQQQIHSELNSLGWTELGSRTLQRSLAGKNLELGGDETPWMGTAPTFSPDSDFRLLLCHTPDHFRRATRQGVDLMLSGHNHGGQVQLPLLGPIYAPSAHGTRYASGTFYSAPTLLHVSRGLSGQHPFRYGARPEATVLRLRTATT